MATRDEELEQLKKLSPYSLPDNPSQSGWSTKQVKAKFYQGLFYLYDLIDGERADVASVQNALDNLNLDDFVTEEEAQSIKNDAMPHIGETPPSLDKTRIWFDTTDESEIVDIETLDEVDNTPPSEQEEMLEEEMSEEPLVFNEYFEPLFFMNSDSNEPLSFGNVEEDLTFENGNNDNLVFEN